MIDFSLTLNKIVYELFIFLLLLLLLLLLLFVRIFFHLTVPSNIGNFPSLLSTSAKLRKVTVSFVMYVCPSALSHGKTRLPHDGFSLHLVFEYFSKNLLGKNPCFIKI